MKGLPDCDMYRKGWEYAQQELTAWAGMASDPIMPAGADHNIDFNRGYDAYYDAQNAVPV